MDRATGILDDRVAFDVNLAGLRVNFDIDQVGAEARCGALGIDRAVADDRSTGLAGYRGNVLEVHRFMRAGVITGRPHDTILESDGIFRDLPEQGRAFARFLGNLATGFDSRHAA